MPQNSRNRQSKPSTASKKVSYSPLTPSLAFQLAAPHTWVAAIMPVLFSIEYSAITYSGKVSILLDLILLGWIENPLILFFAGMVVTCSLEYFVSWLLETLFHKRWWDYTGWPGNINGRVCLIGGIAFGTFTVALIKLIAPVTIDMIDSVSLPALHIMTCVIAFVMIADTVKTVKCMDSSKLWYVEKQAEFMDELRNGRCVGLVKKIKDTFRR